MEYLHKKPLAITVAQAFVYIQIFIIQTFIYSIVINNNYKIILFFIIILLLLSSLLIYYRKRIGVIFYLMSSLLIGGISIYLSSNNMYIMPFVISLLPLPYLFSSDVESYFNAKKIEFKLTDINEDFLIKNKEILTDIIEVEESDSKVLAKRLLFIEKNKYELISISMISKIIDINDLSNVPNQDYRIMINTLKNINNYINKNHSFEYKLYIKSLDE